MSGGINLLVENPALALHINLLAGGGTYQSFRAFPQGVSNEYHQVFLGVLVRASLTVVTDVS
jgi:hypothetical protein